MIRLLTRRTRSRVLLPAPPLAWLGGFGVVSVGLALVVLPSVNPLEGLGILPFGAKRTLQVGLLTLNAGLLLALPSLRGRWLQLFRHLPVSVRWGLGAVLALGVTSSLGAHDVGVALLEVGHYVLLFALALSIACAVREGRHWDGYLPLMIAVAAGFYVLKFLVGFILSLMAPEATFWPTWNLGFTHVRFFNQWQTWSFPLLAAVPLLWNHRVRGGEWLGRFLLAWWWMLLVASGGQGTLLALAVSAAVCGVLFGRAARPWLREMGLGLLAGLVLYGVLYGLLAGVGAGLPERALTSDSGRFDLWRHALDLWQAHPWLGVGPMHYAWFVDPDLAAHPHFALLQWLSEWGAPATLMMVGVALWGGVAWMAASRRIVRTGRRREEALLRIGLTASLLAAAVHASLSGLVVMPLSQLCLALVGGWTLGMHLRAVRMRRTTMMPTIAHGVFLLLIALATAVTLEQVVPEVGKGEERLALYREVVTERKVPPRFWQQGMLGLPPPADGDLATAPLAGRAIASPND